MPRHVTPEMEPDKDFIGQPTVIKCLFCHTEFKISYKFQNACMQEFGYIPCKGCGKHLTMYSIMKGGWY